jgi:uroporphyrinogen-III decarboxylase
LAGVKIRDFYLDPKFCVLVFQHGRKRLREIFRETIPNPGVHCPHNSYGHVSCLGCEIVFPENSEPYAKPAFSNLDDGIRALEEDVDFASSSLFHHHLNMYNCLRNTFIDEKITFSGFGYEGPLTTAGLLRGQGFFTDIHREPEKAREFLKLVTASIVKFVHFLREVGGEEKVNPNSGGLCDDHASFIPPSMWPKFVIPYWDQYYNGITTGKRNLHCENLSPPHLKYLAQAGISYYEPSVSPRLNPQNNKEIDKHSFQLVTFTL